MNVPVTSVQTHKVTRIAKQVYPDLTQKATNPSTGSVFLSKSKRGQGKAATDEIQKTFNPYREDRDFTLTYTALMKLVAQMDFIIELYYDDHKEHFIGYVYAIISNGSEEMNEDIAKRQGSNVKEVVADLMYALLREIDNGLALEQEEPESEQS